MFADQESVKSQRKFFLCWSWCVVNISPWYLPDMTFYLSQLDLTKKKSGSQNVSNSFAPDIFVIFGNTVVPDQSKWSTIFCITTQLSTTQSIYLETRICLYLRELSTPTTWQKLTVFLLLTYTFCFSILQVKVTICPIFSPQSCLPVWLKHEF